MIRITIEKCTGLGNTRREVLGVMQIANDGTGSETVGHYTFQAANRVGNTMATGRILGFPRQQAGAWKLLALALQQMYPSLNRSLTRRRRYGS